MKRILLIVPLSLAVGYILLAFAMDISYDPGTTRSSHSVAEAIGRKTFVSQLRPNKQVFAVAGNLGILKEVWIERNWGYQPHGLLNRLLNVHPTALMQGTSLVIRFEGNSCIKTHLIRWEFGLSNGGGGTFGGGSQAVPLEESSTLPGKLYVRERFGEYNSQLATVDSITLSH